jgi:ADP-ribose pyrophosphatase
MDREFEITKKENKYENPWMRVQEYSILRDGNPGIYGVIERQNSVAIIASPPDGRILFVKQYRFPTESYSWELPMGGVDDGEDPADSAKRELLEETGLEASVSKIGTFHPIPGLTPQLATVFKATITDKKVSDVANFDEDVDEIVDRRLLTRAQITEMISSGEISDGFTLCSLALLNFSQE